MTALESLGLKTSPTIADWNHQSAILDGMMEATVALHDATLGIFMSYLPNPLRSLEIRALTEATSQRMEIILDAKREMLEIQKQIQMDIKFNQETK
jgi:hypothetical protein